MRFIRNMVRVIDWLSEQCGVVASWIILFFMFFMVYNVFMRYVLNNPTSWSFDINYMLGGAMFILGQGWVTKHKKHVTVDILSQRFSHRTQAIINITCTMFLFLPVFLVLAKVFWVDFFRAIEINQTFQQTAWFPPAWPLKFILAWGFSLFFLQGLVNFIREIHTLVTGKDDL